MVFDIVTYETVPKARVWSEICLLYPTYHQRCCVSAVTAVNSGNNTLVVTTQAATPVSMPAPSPQTQPAPPAEPMQTQSPSVSSIPSVPQNTKVFSKLEDMKGKSTVFSYHSCKLLRYRKI